MSKETKVVMNKKEVVQNMAEKTGGSSKDAEKYLKAFIETVSEALKEEKEVQLVGFGTFKTAERTARTGRNPLNGQEIHIAAKKNVKFKAGKTLSNLIK